MPSLTISPGFVQGPVPSSFPIPFRSRPRSRPLISPQPAWNSASCGCLRLSISSRGGNLPSRGPLAAGIERRRHVVRSPSYAKRSLSSAVPGAVRRCCSQPSPPSPTPTTVTTQHDRIVARDTQKAANGSRRTTESTAVAV